MAAGVDLIIQSRPRQASWMAVKKWTLLRGTCRKSRRSGWCFAGINNSCTLFVNWGNKRRRKAVYSGSLEGVTVSYPSPVLGMVRRLPWSPPQPQRGSRVPVARRGRKRGEEGNWQMQAGGTSGKEKEKSGVTW